MNPKLKTKKGATSYFSWDRNWLWPKNTIQLQINAILEGFPNRKKTTTFEVFQRGCSSFVGFSLFTVNISSKSQDSGPNRLNSGARTKGVLEPRLSGLGLRESFCFLATVFNMRWRPTEIHTQNIMNYYPSVSQRSKTETRQFVICGSFSSWTWGTPIAMWVYKKTNDIMFVPHVWTHE